MVKKVSDFKTAKLYADALYKSAENSGEVELAAKDIKALENAEISTIKETEYLSSPIVDLAVKEKLLNEIVKELKLGTKVHNLLKLLVQNGEFKILKLVTDDFEKIYNQKHNIAVIDVETALELTQDQDKILREKLADLFARKIKINYILNPEIIGGLVIRNGTIMIDLSLKNKLKNLEQLMKGTD